MITSSNFNVIVVGAGHAGCEAALASSRLGVRTALISFSKEGIGQMSCNPAIGGLGKGQLVKEVDALFGEMGVVIDETGVQFRTLNSSKGPAVRSSRAQADRDTYKARMRKSIEASPNLEVIEGAVAKLILKGNRISGIELEDGSKIFAENVVLTTGTFLKGLMHTGEEKTKGGRVGDKASYALSDSIASLGLKMGRLKTGTPPRLKRSSINFNLLEEQPGDTPIKPFSFRTREINRPQLSCWITQTNQTTHQIIQENVSRSPMFNGQIESSGPRYCPSIEDKVFRFSDKNSHNIFLEPEGFDSDIVYPNGISSSLPKDVQEAFVRSIKGLENVEILVWGYAVEYDYIDPTQCSLSLELKDIEGLFVAGQINGTSGYEEAAAQGIIAGINAANKSLGKAPFTLGRDEAYIGVMIDDLITKGVMEPYRMFTSRAEYRLHLREDNADIRLTPKAKELGLLSESEWRDFSERLHRIENEKQRFRKTIIKPIEEDNSWLVSLNSAKIEDALSLDKLIKRPEMDYQKISNRFPSEDGLSHLETERVEIELKFEGYLKRQEEDIRRLKKMEEVKIPSELNYKELKALSTEVREKLAKLRPETLGQASRISGVTPAALSLLAVHVKRFESSLVS